MTPIPFADPNWALGATAAGIALVALEFCLPGAVLPASAGGALLLLGVWSLCHQSMNAWAAAAAFAAITLIALGAWYGTPSVRIVAAIAGGIALALALSHLTPEIRWQIAVPIATIFTPLAAWLLSLAALARRIKLAVPPQ